VQHVGLELVVAQHVDARLEAPRVVQVADQNRHAAAFVLGDERLQALLEVGDPHRLQLLQILKYLEDAVLPRVEGMTEPPFSCAAIKVTRRGWRGPT
jgi:hypothetical protein